MLYCGALFLSYNPNQNIFIKLTNLISNKVIQRINSTELSDMIKAQVSLLCSKEHILQTEQRKRGLVQGDAELLLSIIQEISKTEKLRLGLYEQYKQGKFNKEEFIVRREKYTKQIGELVEKKELEKINEQRESKDEMLNRIGEMIEQFKNMQRVDVGYINRLVERVVVYEDDRIEVMWKGKDELAMLKH